MQGGQDNTEYGQQHGQFDHDAAGLFQSQPLHGGRRKFDEEHRQVEGHAGADFEKQGGGTLGHQERIGQPPGLTHVVMQGKTPQGHSLRKPVRMAGRTAA